MNLRTGIGSLARLGFLLSRENQPLAEHLRHKGRSVIGSLQSAALPARNWQPNSKPCRFAFIDVFTRCASLTSAVVIGVVNIGDQIDERRPLPVTSPWRKGRPRPARSGACREPSSWQKHPAQVGGFAELSLVLVLQEPVTQAVPQFDRSRHGRARRARTWTLALALPILRELSTTTESEPPGNG